MMAKFRRMEMLSGISAGILGFTALGVAFFGPSLAQSGTSGSGLTSYASLHGVASTLPYVLVYGGVIGGVTASSTLHSVRGLRSARIALWLLTAALFGGVLIALASIGVLLIPAVMFAIAASALASDAGDRRRASAT